MVNLVAVARRGVVMLLGVVAAIFTAAPAQACTADVPPLKPQVSIDYIADPLNQGNATFAIGYGFPGTEFSYERGLIFRDNDAVIGGVEIHGENGTTIFGPWSVACRTGVHKFTAEAWSHCNFADSEHATADALVLLASKPTVSLHLTGPDESGVVTGQLSYDFPNTTDHQSGREVLTYIDGTYNGDASVAGADVPMHGPKQVTLDTTCWSNGVRHVIAFARACGNSDPAFNENDEQTLIVDHHPSVNITGFDDQPEGTYAKVEFNFPQTSNSSQRLLEIRDQSGTLLGSARPSQRSGTLPIFMVCSAGKPVHASAIACSDPPVNSGDKEPPKCALSCKQPPWVKVDSSSSCCIGDPVHVTSGSMELDDRDPLPGTMVAPLVRTYQSKNPVAGAFGPGWITIMDARASAVGGTDGRDGVFLILEDGRRAMFRRSGGAYAQTYPEDTAMAGTLVFDTSLDAFVHRDAVSTVSRLFRASDGRLTSLVDRRGDAVTLTYDSNGKATAVADAAGRWSWTVSYGTAGFVESISVDGQAGLVWAYAYSNGKLVTVTAPQSSVWRTYVYGSAGLEEVHDARGAVIERHTYDAEGRALSSFGPSGDLTAIQVNLAGRVPGEIRTHVVSADGKTTDYYSRFIAGKMRTAEVAGSCHCTSEDSVFVHDVEGHVIREQNSRGWITVRTFANGRMATQSTFLRPTVCDPQTDTARCRQTPDSLESIALQSTASSHHGVDVWRSELARTAHARDHGQRRPGPAAPGRLHVRRDHRCGPGADILRIQSGHDPGDPAYDPDRSL